MAPLISIECKCRVFCKRLPCIIPGGGSSRSQLVPETKRQALTQITGPGLAGGISHGKTAIATGQVINNH